MFLNNYLYILSRYKSALLYQLFSIIYLGIIILPLQLVNGTQFLNITFLLGLFASSPAPAVLLTYIFPLTSIYVSL